MSRWDNFQSWDKMYGELQEQGAIARPEIREGSHRQFVGMGLFVFGRYDVKG